jgi:dihydrofolate synthase/folylpolyglutamate synthase
VQWPGRFQVIGREPTFVLDAAHNPAGTRALAASLREYFTGQDITVIVGISRDKDAAAILGALAPLARRMILTRARNPRAADPEALRAAAPAAETTSSVAEALALARRASTPVVCVAGSVFVVGEALAELSGGGEKPCPVENPADGIESLFS